MFYLNHANLKFGAAMKLFELNELQTFKGQMFIVVETKKSEAKSHVNIVNHA